MMHGMCKYFHRRGGRMRVVISDGGMIRGVSGPFGFTPAP